MDGLVMVSYFMLIFAAAGWVICLLWALFPGIVKTLFWPGHASLYDKDNPKEHARRLAGLVSIVLCGPAAGGLAGVLSGGSLLILMIPATAGFSLLAGRINRR
ncbi:MAG: hypothetical protein K5985_12560 [Lachnospiraceae bacterium]|nr:hypothetical protein [Lachnospiraceae bacterium]